MLDQVAAGALDAHLDYAQGLNLRNRMPLFVKAARKLSCADAMDLFRTHNELSWFDNRDEFGPDVGAGPGQSPYRRRPLQWEFGGKVYVNERTVSNHLVLTRTTIAIT